MMSKILKYVPVFFLWLAGLTLSAHLIIPHDHHIAGEFLNQDNNCPASNNKDDHHSGFPIHCHALNDLATEKSRPYHISQNVQVSFIEFSRFSDTSASELQLSCLSFFDLQKPVFDSYTLESSLLRAPPPIA